MTPFLTFGSVKEPECLIDVNCRLGFRRWQACGQHDGSALHTARSSTTDCRPFSLINMISLVLPESHTLHLQPHTSTFLQKDWKSRTWPSDGEPLMLELFSLGDASESQTTWNLIKNNRVENSKELLSANKKSAQLLVRRLFSVLKPGKWVRPRSKLLQPPQPEDFHKHTHLCAKQSNR